MAWEPKPNTGSLFRNDKAASDRHPTHKGKLDQVACPHCGGHADYWVSAWVKTANSGSKYFSLAVEPKDQPAAKPAQPQQKPSMRDELDDEIPF